MTYRFGRCGIGVIKGLLTAGVLCANAAAQVGTVAFPSKPVQVIVPFPPGGSVEVEARLYTQKLSDNTGRPFIMDYRPGAGTTIALGQLVKSPRDGHAIMVVSSGLTLAPALYRDLPFDPIKGIAPITLLSKRANLLLVHPSLPPRTATEYLAYLRSNPGQLNYGTPGPGTSGHLSGVLLHNLSKTVVTYVHYKGTGAMMPDLLAGRVHATATTFISGMPHVKTGKLRLLAVTADKRLSILPEVPTLAEQGVAGYEHSGWLGVATVAGTPPEYVRRLHEELVKAGKAPEVSRKLGEEGAVVVLNSPEEFRQFLNIEVTTWAKVAREAGLKAED